MAIPTSGTEFVINRILDSPADLGAVCIGHDAEGTRNAYWDWSTKRGYVISDEGVDWDEVSREINIYCDPDLLGAPTKMTVEEIGRDAIERNLPLEETVGRLVDAHHEALGVILDAFDDHAERMGRMKRQLNDLVIREDG